MTYLPVSGLCLSPLGLEEVELLLEASSLSFYLSGGIQLHVRN